MAVQSASKPAARRTGARSNRRVSVRYGAPASTAKMGTPEGVLLRQVRVYDLSTGGIALIMAKPLEASDDTYYIQLNNRLLGFSYDLAAQVRHSTPHIRGQYIVGFSFLRELT